MGTVTIGMGNAGTTTTGPQYRLYESGGCKWRTGIRNCQFVKDRTLTATGFDGVEDTDWKNEDKAGPAS